ncbi:hypothetical protein IQ07DRAFT_605466 [Pyrenochaeta sp. DS3sAY3a]|nr:hypothetical protein IQ07DRAFT_605466 [Pyrenochaeta sp. DS3sAY3a]
MSLQDQYLRALRTLPLATFRGPRLDFPPVFRVPDPFYEYFLSLYIHGTLVEAFPDNCSEVNLISQQLIRNDKLDDYVQTLIRLPNGTMIETSGSVTYQCKFTEDGETFNVKFAVLPRCLHNVVLSDSFLRSTQTDLVLGSRIQYKSLKSSLPIQVCLSGSPPRYLRGSINGKMVLASPDIGSNANIITVDEANACGLVVDRRPEKSLLYFVDGSFVETCGIVRAAEWQFGGLSTTTALENLKEPRVLQPLVSDWAFGTGTYHSDIFICDFHVVKTLTVPVILSSTLLYGTNAFIACAQHFGRTDTPKFSAASQEDYSDIAVVALVDDLVADFIERPIQKSKSISKGFVRKIKGGKVPNAPQANPSVSVGQEAEEEGIRRGEEERRIERLPQREQAAARDQEKLRRENWKISHPDPTPSSTSQGVSPSVLGSSSSQVQGAPSLSAQLTHSPSATLVQASSPSSSPQSTTSALSLTSTNAAQVTTTAAISPMPPSPIINHISAPPSPLPAPIGLPAQLQGASTPMPNFTPTVHQSASCLLAQVPSPITVPPSAAPTVPTLSNPPSPTHTIP